MNQTEKKNFAERFLELYLANGLGSLPKSEIDLYIFHLLTQTTEYRGKSNYDLANLLKIPETRIKSLRLNSALKYSEINSKAILSKVVIRLTSSEQFASFQSGKIEVSLEDPIEQRELENFLKVRGYHAEYSLNSEVLKISPIRLFELIMDNVDNAKDEFNSIVQEHLADSENLEDLIRNSLSMGQKFGKLRKEALNADTLRALVGAAVGLL